MACAFRNRFSWYGENAFGEPADMNTSATDMNSSGFYHVKHNLLKRFSPFKTKKLLQPYFNRLHKNCVK